MIKRVEIKNFENIKERTFYFSNGLNMLTGPSDVGKSAVLNAIIFALTNFITGDKMIKHGERTCSVLVAIGDFEIERVKGDGINKVIFKDLKNNEVKVFENFGHEYPKEIWDRLKEVGIKEFSLFFLPQFAGHFFLQSTPLERSRFISSFFAFFPAESLLSVFQSRKREIEQEIKWSKETAEKEKKKAEAVEEFIQFCEKLLEMEKDLNNLKEKYKTIQRGKTILSLKEKAKKFLKWFLSEKRDVLTPLIKSFEKKIDAFIEKGGYLEQIKEIRNIENEIEQKRKELESLESEFIELLKEERICPLCGSPIKDIEKIIKRL